MMKSMEIEALSAVMVSWAGVTVCVRFVVLVADYINPWLRRRRNLRELRTRMARQAARQQRNPSAS